MRIGGWSSAGLAIYNNYNRQYNAMNKALYITDHFEIYAGKDFMTKERLEALEEIITSGKASNISEAIVVFKSKDYQTGAKE